MVKNEVLIKAKPKRGEDVTINELSRRLEAKEANSANESPTLKLLRDKYGREESKVEQTITLLIRVNLKTEHLTTVRKVLLGEEPITAEEEALIIQIMQAYKKLRRY
ncbi:MAG: hypothetical protein WCW27_02550 [Patescibacteria group bacterium]|jgi:hypothetical protein